MMTSPSCMHCYRAMEELEKMLARHIEREEYEEAAKVQAVINAKKAGNA